MSLTRSLTFFKDPSYQETINKPLTLHSSITCCSHLISFQQQIPLFTNQYGRRTAGCVKEMSGRGNNHQLEDGCWKHNKNLWEDYLRKSFHRHTVPKANNHTNKQRFFFSISAPVTDVLHWTPTVVLFHTTGQNPALLIAARWPCEGNTNHDMSVSVIVETALNLAFNQRKGSSRTRI